MLEDVPPLSLEVAKEITEEIKEKSEHLWERIVLAYQGRAWVPLGYSSWDDYCESEFHSLKVRLPRQERQEVVQSLRDQGLSLRAIASAAGIDKRTVSRDLAGNESGDDVVTPPTTTSTSRSTDHITGTNGKQYRQRRDFPSSFWTVAYDVGRLGTRIQKLAGDSRFEDSLERIRSDSLKSLVDARNRLDSVINRIQGGSQE